MQKKSRDYKLESQEDYNKRASKFDSSFYGKHGQKLHLKVLKMLNNYSFQNLLDIGCGTGNLLSLIQEKYQNLQLSGIDISPNMLKIAHDKLGAKANLKVADSEDLPFEDESFDIITCVDSFHHYPHPEKVLEEIMRVLKSEGRIIIADVWAPTPLRQLGNLIIKLRKAGAVRFYSKPEISELLKSTGFKNIEWKHIDRMAFIITGTKNSKLNINWDKTLNKKNGFTSI